MSLLPPLSYHSYHRYHIATPHTHTQHYQCNLMGKNKTKWKHLPELQSKRDIYIFITQPLQRGLQSEKYFDALPPRLPNKFLLDVCQGWCASHVKNSPRCFLILMSPTLSPCRMLPASDAALFVQPLQFKMGKPCHVMSCLEGGEWWKNRYLISAPTIKMREPFFRGAAKQRSHAIK